MVTAILLKWKREKELDIIIAHLKKIPFISEIKIHDNRKDNLFTYGRYIAARTAINSIIYTQDDDCVVKNIRALFDQYDGTQIVNAMKPLHMQQYSGKETLLGWGSFFQKEWIQVFDTWINTYGQDYLLYRGADRIFTTLVGKHKSLPADLEEFASAKEKTIALYRRKDYWHIINKIRKRLKVICQ